MKKVFLSLATIAFVAAGSLTMTSCGSDDSSTTPGGENPGGENPGGGNELTTNFIEVDGDQVATGESRWYVRCEGSGATAPVIEYTLSESDPTLYAVYDLVTFSEPEGKMINVIYAVKVDESKTVESGERYYYPYTGDASFTKLLSAYYVDGNKDFKFDTNFQMKVSALDYQGDTMAYEASGTAVSKDVKVNFDGIAKGMYILDMTQGAKGKALNNIGKADLSKATNFIK